MTELTISPEDNYIRHRIPVLDSEMAYVDEGEGDPIVFLHGNPTSSYLWRNVIPHVKPLGRCLAPDLIGMGDSGKLVDCNYRFMDHAKYLDAWFNALNLTTNVNLVLHDWGSALGFYWANRHQERVRTISYMEAFVQPLTWDMWPESGRQIFQAIRSPAGEKIILEKNAFIKNILPASVIRALTKEELAAYDRPFKIKNKDRLPMLTWPREIPLDGEPKDICDIVSKYASWLKTTDIPKLFINAEPGSILTGEQREFCRTWSNQTEVTVAGRHFIQEDSPTEIGKAINRFLSKRL